MVNEILRAARVKDIKVPQKTSDRAAGSKV